MQFLKPEEEVEVLSVPLSDTITQPRTMVVVSAYAFLTHSAMSGSKGHINEALRAVSKRNLNFSRFLTPLHSGEIFLVTGLLLMVFSGRLLHLLSILNRNNI